MVISSTLAWLRSSGTVASGEELRFVLASGSARSAAAIIARVISWDSGAPAVFRLHADERRRMNASGASQARARGPCEGHPARVSFTLR
jgi:hypothetical protein